MALTLYRDNVRGGDPDMSFVAVGTVQSLARKGLVVSALAPDGKRLYARERIPTALGDAVLDSYTYGPAVAR